MGGGGGKAEAAVAAVAVAAAVEAVAVEVEEGAARKRHEEQNHEKTMNHNSFIEEHSLSRCELAVPVFSSAVSMRADGEIRTRQQRT